MDLSTDFFTDTAEICVFDPVCLKHRFSDSADLWTVPSEALKEMNDANIMFVDVGADDTYLIEIKLTDTPLQFRSGVSSVVKCKSGVLFIEPGEETTSDECEPTDEFGSLFLNLKSAIYLVQMSRKKNQIKINISQTSNPPQNFHSRLLKLSE